MKTITINRTNNTIEITKAFDKKASVYGSAEYNMLQNAMRENEGFSVVVAASRKANNNPFSKLSFDYMEKYIKLHDDENQSIMKEYLKHRALDEESILNGGVSQSRDTICEWFVNQYPEIRDFHNKRKQFADEMAEIKRARKAKLEEAKLSAKVNSLLVA